MRVVVGMITALLVTTCASAANVECLSGVAARSVFLSEKNEPYFSLLQPREMAAKTGAIPAGKTLQRQHEQLRTTYRNAVEECSDGESKGLETYISIIDSSVAKRYPGLVALPWRFVKVDNKIEGGLPHTRGNVIVLSELMMRVINETATTGYLRPDIMQILLHEQVHVLERSRPQLFASLYAQWGFKKAHAIHGAEKWLATHQIVNPDGVDVSWVWPVPNSSRVIWPLVILAGESPTPAMPGDFRMIGIELTTTVDGYTVVTDKQGTPLYHALDDEKAYRNRFAASSSLYHPNEIAADYLSELALWDTLVDKSKLPAVQQAKVDGEFKMIRGWAKKNLAQ